MQIRTYFQMPMLGRSASPMHGSDTTICIATNQVSKAACCQSSHGVGLQVCVSLSANVDGRNASASDNGAHCDIVARKTPETATVHMHHVYAGRNARIHALSQ
jgi:hypothetical protein